MASTAAGSSRPSRAAAGPSPMRFSSLAIIHTALGCSDEEADITERAERLLYFFPSEVNMESQLRHVGFCEGLIQFASQFAVKPSPTQSVTLNRRRYIFYSPEPQVWMILVVSVPTVDSTAPDYFTMAPEGDADSAAGRSRRGSMLRRGATPEAEAATGSFRYAHDYVSDDALYSVLRQLWHVFMLFYGTAARVMSHPCTQLFITSLARLRTQLRKTLLTQERELVNYRNVVEEASAAALQASMSGVLNTAATQDAAHTAYTEQLLCIRTRYAKAVQDADVLQAAIERAVAVSPVHALRCQLRSIITFQLHYIDWSCLSAFDALDTVRAHTPKAACSQLLREFITRIQAMTSQVEHVAVCYDGHMVAGQFIPRIFTFMRYMRQHAFHGLLPSFVLDQRPMDVTSLTRIVSEAATAARCASPAMDDVSALAAGAMDSPRDMLGADSPTPIPPASQSGVASKPEAVAFENALCTTDPFTWYWTHGLPRTAAAAIAALASQKGVAGARSPRASPVVTPSAPAPARAAALSATTGAPSSARSSRAGTRDGAESGVLPFRHSWLHRPAAAEDASGSGNRKLGDMSRFYMSRKPASAAAPTFPASAIGWNGTRSVVGIPSQFPALQVPYTSFSYLLTVGHLANEMWLLSGGSADACVSVEALSATPVQPRPAVLSPGASSSGVGTQYYVSSGAQMVSSSNAMGPPFQSRGDTTPSGSSTAAARSTLVPYSLPEPMRIFCPALFLHQKASVMPSHRALWFQYDLITIIVMVRCRPLVSAPTIATVPTALCDVSERSLYPLIADLDREFRASVGRLEAACSDSIHLTASAAASRPQHAAKFMQHDLRSHVIHVNGIPGITRPPGRARDADNMLVSRAGIVTAREYYDQLPLVCQALMHQTAPLLVDKSEFAARSTATTVARLTPILRHMWTCLNPAVTKAVTAAKDAARAALVEDDSREAHNSSALDLSVTVAEAASLPPLPDAEEHILLTRHAGGVGVRRNQFNTYCVFDFRLPLGADVSSIMLEHAGIQLGI